MDLASADMLPSDGGNVPVSKLVPSLRYSVKVEMEPMDGGIDPESWLSSRLMLVMDQPTEPRNDGMVPYSASDLRWKNCTPTHACRLHSNNGRLRHDEYSQRDQDGDVNKDKTQESNTNRCCGIVFKEECLGRLLLFCATHNVNNNRLLFGWDSLVLFCSITFSLLLLPGVFFFRGWQSGLRTGATTKSSQRPAPTP